MQQRMLSCMLAGFLFSGSLISCGEKGREDAQTQPDSRPDPVSSTSAAEETKPHYAAQLPEDLSFGGAEVRILVYDRSNPTWYDVDFSAEEETGEPLADAAYRRTAAVEDLLHVDIRAVPGEGYGYPPLLKSVTAEEGLYDAGFAATRSAVLLAQSGYLYDLHDLETMNLSEPWWDQNAVHDLSVGHRLFMVTGDIGTMYKKSIGVLLFNKALLHEYDMESPYALVRDRRWTVDRFRTMAREVSSDVNGDGVFDRSDRYGLLYYSDMIALGLIGGGTRFTSKNEEDYPRDTFYNERTQGIWEDYTALLYQPEYALSWSKIKVSNEDIMEMFRNNQGLFNFNEFHAIEHLRQMDADFGILPFPLYEETQERYYHTINPHVAAMLLVPKDCPDPERIGYVLDALGAASKNELTPAYYEQYLKTKGARDQESEAMLDLIFGSLVYDIGYLYDFGGMGGFTLSMADRYEKDLASAYEKIRPAADRAIAEAIEAYRLHE